MMKKMDKKAFTLIELIVVIAVIGILVLLAVPRFIGHTQKAELARIQHDVKMMEKEMGAEFINKDDDFNEWGNNSKDLNQLVQDDELFETEGVAEEVDPVDGTYKIIPGEYKDKINTKLKGTFYVNSHGKVYYEHGQGPGYSDEEIEDLIKNHDFIPVADADELHNVRYNEPNLFGKGTKWGKEYTGGLDKKYVQVKNINLSGYSEGKGWEPIGTFVWNDTSASSFTGTYDGGNYVITRLEVKGDSKDYQGLFGFTEEATISNVGLIDNKVTGKAFVGGLVGQADETAIENSYSTGSVTGTGDNVGGLVGQAQSGTTISNSYSTGDVTGTNWSHIGGLVGMAYSNIEINNSYATGSVKGAWASVGGLVGMAYFSTNITDSYATGTVEGLDDIGGLVGGTWESTITNSYATGLVKGRDNVGGLVGQALSKSTITNSYAKGSATSKGATGSPTGPYYEVGGLVGLVENSTISNSYATGSVIGTHTTGSIVGTYKIGGLMGGVKNSTISNSYWDTETTGQEESAGQDESFGKTTVEMKLKYTYEGWDFDTVWEIDEGNDYPKLK